MAQLRSCVPFRGPAEKRPLVHSVKGKDVMAYDDPRWMGGIGMIGTKAVYNAVMHCDLLLMVGTDYPCPEFLPRKGTVVQIDEHPQVLGVYGTPTVLGVVGIPARPKPSNCWSTGLSPKNITTFGTR